METRGLCTFSRLQRLIRLLRLIFFITCMYTYIEDFITHSASCDFNAGLAQANESASPERDCRPKPINIPISRSPPESEVRNKIPLINGIPKTRFGRGSQLQCRAIARGDRVYMPSIYTLDNNGAGGNDINCYNDMRNKYLQCHFTRL